MADNRARVEAPTGTPHRYGLLSVAEIRPQGDGKWLNGIQFDQTCGNGVARGYVPCDTPPEDFVKEPTDLDLGNEADALVLYAMVQCGMIGGVTDTSYAEAELDAGEARALEEEFALEVWASATSIGTTADVKAGVAALLDAWPSGIEPTIHMSPNVALLSDFIERDGDVIRLKTGEKVAVGYGYKAGAGLTGVDAGALFITGPVWGYQGNLVTAGAPLIVDNEYTQLAERPWLITTLCESFKITLTNLLP